MYVACSSLIDQLYKEQAGTVSLQPSDASDSLAPSLYIPLLSSGPLSYLDKEEQSVCVLGVGVSLPSLTTYFPELFINTYSSKDGKVKIEG